VYHGGLLLKMTKPQKQTPLPDVPHTQPTTYPSSEKEEKGGNELSEKRKYLVKPQKPNTHHKQRLRSQVSKKERWAGRGKNNAGHLEPPKRNIPANFPEKKGSRKEGGLSQTEEDGRRKAEKTRLLTGKTAATCRGG